MGLKRDTGREKNLEEGRAPTVYGEAETLSQLTEAAQRENGRANPRFLWRFYTTPEDPTAQKVRETPAPGSNPGRKEKQGPQKPDLSAWCDGTYCNPALWEAETGGGVKVGQFSDLVRPCLKNKQRAGNVAQCEYSGFDSQNTLTVHQSVPSAPPSSCVVQTGLELCSSGWPGTWNFLLP